MFPRMTFYDGRKKFGLYISKCILITIKAKNRNLAIVSFYLPLVLGLNIYLATLLTLSLAKK